MPSKTIVERWKTSKPSRRHLISLAAKTSALSALKKRIESANDQIKIQGSNGNWNHDSYMLGMFNGMECVLATVEGREPQFRRKPKKGFLEDNTPKNFKPLAVQQNPASPKAGFFGKTLAELPFDHPARRVLTAIDRD